MLTLKYRFSLTSRSFFNKFYGLPVMHFRVQVDPLSE